VFIGRSALAAALFLVVACSGNGPPCDFPVRRDTAPSAGCFSTSQDGLLLVQGLNGKVSVPGGSSAPGEYAQCTAFRETWEETGLRLKPGELLQVFSPGFHLYRCEPDATSGAIDPPMRLEVRAAFYLPADRFESYDWRYEDERELLKHMLMAAEPGATQ